MNYQLSFGSYTFPATLMPASEASAQDLAAQQRPRASGAITQIGRREKTLLSIRGAIKGDTPTDLASKHQALKAAVYNGKQPLFFGRDDRYFKDAQLASFGSDYGGGPLFGLIANYSLTFEASDYPEAWDTSSTTVALSTGTGGTVAHSPGGDSAALPVWTLTLGSAPSSTAVIALTNLRTGEAAQLDVSGLASGNILTLTRDGYRVAVGGTSTPGILRGRIPTLVPDGSGPNNLVLTPVGVTLSAASVTYYPRWK